MADIVITPNFKVIEFACHDGTPYPLTNDDMESLPSGYILPGDKARIWQWTRLYPLCLTLEALRAALGAPITIDSGYRTLAYDDMLYKQHVAAVGDDGQVAPASRSQHPNGRAADIKVAGIAPSSVFNKALAMFEAGSLPYLGGIGLYPTFVHVDVRPRSQNGVHLAIWGGARPSNIA